MGIFGLILMFAPAIGPTLSGWIIEHYDWRMLFYFITPFAVAVFLIGFFLLKDKKEKRYRLDFVSFFYQASVLVEFFMDLVLRETKAGIVLMSM